ncbi:hypothetical protein BC643_1170 [Mangrovibacterium diazotrophicum]|uniref:Uncharacterized protein n=1 Tax=Mangrovibacterium diazotrophicum TaxID=1261403 RepID=A0A419W5W2_9BACT|nr:hypothetical protein BC643_1170 [Mangrovibacterium diazotrophicum]
MILSNTKFNSSIPKELLSSPIVKSLLTNQDLLYLYHLVSGIDRSKILKAINKVTLFSPSYLDPNEFYILQMRVWIMLDEYY